MTRGRDHRLAVEHFITHRFAMDEAGEGWRLLDQGGLPVLAAVLQISGHDRTRRPRFRAPYMPGHKTPSDTCRVVLVAPDGAPDITGLLAKMAEATREEDYDAADAVVIACQGFDQSVPAIAALKADKPALVIGALANSEQAHDDIVHARRSSAGFLLGGHPARFAPSCRLLRNHIAAASIPVNALIRRVDDQPAEPSAIDLARFLIGMPVASVRAVRVTAPAGHESADRRTWTSPTGVWFRSFAAPARQPLA